MMISLNNKYSHKVLIIIGTLHIDQMVELATAEELSNLGPAWTWETVGRKVIVKQLQLTRGELELMINRIKGEAKLTKNVVIPSRRALKTVGMANLPMMSKRVNIARDGITGFQEGKVELCPSYKYVKPGGLRVVVALYINTQEKIALTKGTIVVKVTAANAIPPMLAPTKSTYHDVPQYDKNQKSKNTHTGECS